MNVWGILSQIKFEHHPTIWIRMGGQGTDLWLQLQDKSLPDDFNTGRKFRLSEHMTRSEVVGTVFAAYKAWIEHEMFESFTYKGVAVFNPHVDIEARVALVSNPDNYEYRS